MEGVYITLIAIAIGALLIGREVALWYFGVKDLLKELRAILDELAKQTAALDKLKK